MLPQGAKISSYSATFRYTLELSVRSDIRDLEMRESTLILSANNIRSSAKSCRAARSTFFQKKLYLPPASSKYR